MTKPKRITPADLVAGGVDVWDGDVDELIDLAVAEMGKRLRDTPADIPAHVLVKLAEAANKAAERRQQAADRREQQQTAGKDEIEIIVDSTLPAEKKRVLLEEALRRLEQRAATLRELLQRGDI